MMESHEGWNRDVSKRESLVVKNILETQIALTGTVEANIAQIEIDIRDKYQQAAFVKKVGEKMSLEPDHDKEVVAIYTQLAIVLEKIAKNNEEYKNTIDIHFEKEIFNDDGDISEITVFTHTPKNSSEEVLEELREKSRDLYKELDQLSQILEERYPKEYSLLQEAIVSGKIEHTTN